MAGSSGGYTPPKDNTAEMMLLFQQQTEDQERRFRAMESARMDSMMQMEQLRLAHEEKMREATKRSEMEAERLLREDTEDVAQEAESIYQEQDVDTEEGITIDWMTALQQGLQGEQYPE